MYLVFARQLSDSVESLLIKCIQGPNEKILMAVNLSFPVYHMPVLSVMVDILYILSALLNRLVLGPGCCQRFGKRIYASLEKSKGRVRCV